MEVVRPSVAELQRRLGQMYAENLLDASQDKVPRHSKESMDELAEKINCSTSAEKPPLDQNPAAGSASDDSQLLEPSHKKARTDHTPAAGEYQLMLAERSRNDAE